MLSPNLPRFGSTFTFPIPRKLDSNLKSKLKCIEDYAGQYTQQVLRTDNALTVIIPNGFLGDDLGADRGFAFAAANLKIKGEVDGPLAQSSFSLDQELVSALRAPHPY